MKDKPGKEEIGIQLGQSEAAPGEGESESDVASRARNKTVMLTPELTGQLRSLLRPGAEGDINIDPGATATSLGDIVKPTSSDGWQTAHGAEGGVSLSSPGASPQAPAQPIKSDPLANLSPSSVSNVSPMNTLMSGATGLGGLGVDASSPQVSGGSQLSNGMGVSQGGGNPPAFAVNPSQAPSISRKSKVVGFLVSFDKDDKGEVFEVLAGRWLLSSRASGQEDSIIVEDESISPLHAVLRITEEGKIQVLDQLSEHGTGVTRKGSDKEEDISGAMVSLEHGDKIRFGKRNFVVCVIPG